MRNWIVLAALTLAACNGGEDDKSTDTDFPTDETNDDATDSEEPTDTDSEEPTETDTEVTGCTAEVETIIPRDDAINVAVDSVIAVSFTEAVPSESDLSIAIDGVSGTTALASDGLSATFTPDADFATETEYEVEVEVCEDSASASFTTSAPPLDESDLVGRTYVLDMDEVTWEAPSLMALVAGDLALEFLMLEVLEYDETSAELSFAVAIGESRGANVVQTDCYPVIDFSEVDFSSNPNFVLGPQDITVPVDATTDATMEDFTFSGAFSSDGDALESIVIEALIDTEPFDAFVEDKLGMTTCEASATFFGESCVACDEGDETCLETIVTADEATYDEHAEVDESYDPETDTDC